MCAHKWPVAPDASPRCYGVGSQSWAVWATAGFAGFARSPGPCADRRQGVLGVCKGNPEPQIVGEVGHLDPQTVEANVPSGRALNATKRHFISLLYGCKGCQTALVQLVQQAAIGSGQFLLLQNAMEIMYLARYAVLGENTLPTLVEWLFFVSIHVDTSHGARFPQVLIGTY